MKITLPKKIMLFLISMLLCCALFSAERPDWLAVKSWGYQLGDYTDNKLDEIKGTNFDLVVIDLTRDGNDDFFTKDEIDAVKDSGKYVLAYFEIGAIENYRPEWKDVSNDLKAGAVDGWPEEQYVKFWDERWWPVVKGRIDQALKAGFDGAYLDMVTTYEEIPGTKLSSEERAKKMVDLIDRISKYAKKLNPNFKIVPQNAPELYTWTPWDGKPNQKYINAIDGVALESVFYMAHDKPANKGWCKENRDNALAIKKAGKLLLGVDYAKKPETMKDGYAKQREAGFVPYVTVVELNCILKEGDAPPASKRHKKKKK